MKTILLFVLMAVCCSAANIAGLLGGRPPAAGGAPNLVSATINADGDELTMVFDASVSFGAGGNGGFDLTPRFVTVLGDVTLTYSSGSGSTTLVYTINSRPIHSSAYENATIAYTQPGDGVEAGGTDLATFTAIAATNNSTYTQGATFVHNFDSRDAQVYAGDGTGDAAGGSGASISSAQSLDGATSLACTGTSFPLNEFNTNPSTNPDFVWEQGRIETYIRWTGSWPSGNAWLFSLKNELGTTAGIWIVFRGGTTGSLRLYFGNTSNPTTVTGFTADTWHKVTITWDQTGPGGIYATFQLNSDTAVNRTVSIPTPDATETQILEGNDTATSADFYIGGLFRVWPNTAGTP